MSRQLIPLQRLHKLRPTRPKRTFAHRRIHSGVGAAMAALVVSDLPFCVEGNLNHVYPGKFYCAVMTPKIRFGLNSSLTEAIVTALGKEGDSNG